MNKSRNIVKNILTIRNNGHKKTIYVCKKGDFAFMIKHTILFSTFIIVAFTCYSQNKKATKQEYFEKFAPLAVKEMKRTGIPASITLAQGSLESNNGNSVLATKGNNHFGIKCHKDWEGEKMYMDDDEKGECFRVYKKAEDSYDDHSDFLMTRQRYAGLFKLNQYDYKAWAQGLKDAGYATNPQYPQLLIKLIEDNKLYEYDNEGALAKNKRHRTVDLSKIAPPPVLVDIDSFTISLPERKIKRNNRSKFIISKNGDTYESIAKEFDMMPWQVYRFNDIPKDSSLKPNQVVYIQHKRRNSEKKYIVHIAQKGETLQSISQTYGVKLRRVLKLNNMKEVQPIEAGQQVFVHR